MTRAESWQKTSSESFADCRVFKVRRDESTRTGDGRHSDFFVIESPDWVNIIAVTRGGEVVLIEQFRHGTEDIQLELPGGLIDPGEQPQAAAARELLEETGYASVVWELLGTSRPNPAIQNNTIYHYLATGCEKSSETAFDPNESILTKLVSDVEVESLLRTGNISHSLVLAAFLYYRYYLEAQHLA